MPHQDPLHPPSGRPLSGGKAPYGYMWRDRRLVLDPVESPVRKMIYDLFAKLQRKKAVARALNDAGFRTRAGAKWSDTTIDRLIRDTTAKGSHRGPEVQNPASTTEPRLPVIEDIEPVVSEALWAECNALLDGNGLGQRRGRQAVHLFAGVTVCQCGSRMYVPTHSVNYRCSTCGNRIPADDLEAIFVDQLKSYRFTSDPDAAANLELNRKWPSLTYEEKRRIVGNITERIVVAQDEIDITLYQFPVLATETPPQSNQDPAITPTLSTNPTPDTPTKVDPVALAVAMLRDHPDWSARKLAASIGCSHTTLTRSRLFQTAKALASTKGRRHTGWKTAAGDIEAVAEGGDE